MVPPIPTFLTHSKDTSVLSWVDLPSILRCSSLTLVDGSDCVSCSQSSRNAGRGRCPYVGYEVELLLWTTLCMILLRQCQYSDSVLMIKLVGQRCHHCLRPCQHLRQALHSSSILQDLQSQREKESANVHCHSELYLEYLRFLRCLNVFQYFSMQSTAGNLEQIGDHGVLL